MCYKVHSSQYSVNTFQCKASFTLPSIAVTRSLIMMACYVEEFSCCVPYCVTDIWHCSWFCSQNRDTLHAYGHRICYYWKGMSTNCPYMIKCQWYMVSLMPVLHFSSVSALFQKDGLKNEINRMHKFTHTNKYRYLLAALWGHDFPITYTEIEKPHWQTPLGYNFNCSLMYRNNKETGL